MNVVRSRYECRQNVEQAETSPFSIRDLVHVCGIVFEWCIPSARGLCQRSEHSGTRIDGCGCIAYVCVTDGCVESPFAFLAKECQGRATDNRRMRVDGSIPCFPRRGNLAREPAQRL